MTPTREPRPLAPRRNCKAAQADLAAIERGGSQEQILNLDVELTKARTDRDSAERNLNALKKLKQEGAASAGEVQRGREHSHTRRRATGLPQARTD